MRQSEAEAALQGWKLSERWMLSLSAFLALACTLRGEGGISYHIAGLESPSPLKVLDAW